MTSAKEEKSESSSSDEDEESLRELRQAVQSVNKARSKRKRTKSSLEELCTVNGVKFEKLQKGSGKNVKSLEMFFSGFPKIIGMENFPSLQSLTLMGQQITMLENLECLPNLTELCVSESKLSVSQFLYDTVHCIPAPPPPPSSWDEFSVFWSWAAEIL